MVRDGEEALNWLFGAEGQTGQGAKEMPVVLDPAPESGRPRGFVEDRRTMKEPVVILTSSKEQEDLVKCYKGGANSYIRKPVDFNDFTEAVRQLGLYWLVLNQRPDAGR